MNIAVVGGGVIGSLVSLELVSKGSDVTIFDSSLKSNFRASHGYRLSGVFWQNNALRDLMKEGSVWWRSFLASYGKEDFTVRDMLEIFPDVASMEMVEKILIQFDVEYVKGSSKYFDGANLVYPEAAQLINIDRILPVLKNKLFASGVKCEVREFLTEKDLFGLNEYFDRVIVANGSWIKQFSDLIGVPLRSTRQNWYSVEGIKDDGLPYFKDMRNAHRIIPDGSGVRVFNGTVGEEFEPGDEKFSEMEIDSLERYLKSWFKDSKPILQGHSCQYECTKDYLPLLTKVAGVTFLCPPAGGGVKTGPALASACVNLALDDYHTLPQFEKTRFLELDNPS